MRLIEIQELDNGAHNNQTIHGVIPVPGGWAVIPDDMSVPDTFPFVMIEVNDLGGVMTVTNMTAGIVPEPEPIGSEPTELEQLRADVDYIAMETGIEL